MALLVQIITRSAPLQAVRVVETAFAGAGLETMLTVLHDDEDSNTDLLLQGLSHDVHPRQVWIVPAIFADLLVMDQDRTAAVRELTGMGHKALAPNRLLITLEPVAEVPHGCIVITLDDLRTGQITPEVLQAYFE